VADLKLEELPEDYNWTASGSPFLSIYRIPTDVLHVPIQPPN